MPVTIFRRHSRTCPHKAEGRAWDRCDCPYWADPRPIGPLQSLKTNVRSEALQMARDMELSGAKFHSKQEPDAPITIEQAKKEFLDSLSFQELATETVRKHKTLLTQCESFAKDATIHYVREFDRAVCARFAKTWQNGIKDKDGIQIKKTEGALARGKKLERLRQFFKFCVLRKWIEENPTTGMKSPKSDDVQVEPFEANETVKLLTTARAAIEKARSIGEKQNCIRMVAMILFLRYSGLRIGDVVACRTEWVQNGASGGSQKKTTRVST